MKQHLSVLGLAARSTIYKVLWLFVILAIAQGSLFYFTLQKNLAGEPIGLEQVISQSRIATVSGVCFLALCVLLSLTGTELGGSKVRYTLLRLSVPEKTTGGQAITLRAFSSFGRFSLSLLSCSAGFTWPEWTRRT
ncbi:MAG TPA: hypothetical protein GX512_06755 [Firmicutes bacterium]|nr:hypothetical protein [Candidatus Fermentithermobacillaceae bacterium]